MKHAEGTAAHLHHFETVGVGGVQRLEMETKVQQTSAHLHHCEMLIRNGQHNIHLPYILHRFSGRRRRRLDRCEQCGKGLFGQMLDLRP